MLSPPSTLLRLPRVFLEHPLPLDGPGVSFSTTCLSSSGPSAGFSLPLTLGGVDPFQRSTQASAPPGLTLDSFALLAVLLSLTERHNGTLLTYNQLFRALTLSRSCCSAHHRESLKASLAALCSTHLSLSPLDGAALPVFQPLIALTPAATRPVFGRQAPAFTVSFAPALLDCIADPRASAPFLLSSFLSLRSRYARVLYPILSSWASYSARASRTPFRISLSKLLLHLGVEVPRFLSQRRAFFAGHRSRSLFDDLQGLPTPHGYLCLSLEAARSTSDDCLVVRLSPTPTTAAVPFTEAPLATAEPPPAATVAHPPLPFKDSSHKFSSLDAPKRFSHTNKHIPVASATPTRPPTAPHAPNSSHRSLKLFEAWAASGRAETEFLSRVRNTSISLSQEDLSTLLAARITPSRCESFLLMAKKLLPSRTWLDLLGEAKYAALSAAPPRNPTGKLITEALSALRSGI